MTAGARTGDADIVTRHSPGTVDGTLIRLLTLAQARGVTVFATIDHSGAAAAAGLRMPDTRVVLLGRPEAGTPLMLAAPLVALDLPMRVLIAENADGGCRVSYHPAAALAARHDIVS